MLLKQPSENVLLSDKTIVGIRMYDMLIDEDPLRQVKFVRLFKVTVLNLLVSIIKPEITPEIKPIISAARPYWS